MTPITFASLPLSAASLLLDAAIAHAETLQLSVSVAVVDHAGHLLGFKRMPGAALHTIDIAQDKAYSAVSFGRPTGDWDARLAEQSSMLRHGLMLRERFVGFAGGLPVLLDGARLGAIGVSGGSEAQDVACAQAALTKLTGAWRRDGAAALPD